MNERTHYYGKFEKSRGYPVADWIFGHRLYDGQGWMEYLLEFLNVLVGFDYRLGQGTDNEPGARGYRRNARYGLRRFIFYGDSEKTKDTRDDIARDWLLRVLKERAVGSNGDGSPLDAAQELLRSYSAVEASRSWYAKSLFPAHEKLLFWEARRKGARASVPREEYEDSSPAELDDGMELGTRNFFSRGGEIYYLILSAGTRDEPERRELIEGELRKLLTETNPAIGRLATLIDDTWQELLQGNGSGEAGDGDVRLGWIPDADSALYRAMAEDVEMLLRAELDPLESLDLLAHLICFHLLVYIYYRTNLAQEGDGHSGETSLDLRGLMLPVDCLEGQRPNLRQVSASRYKEHEQLQIQRARRYARRRVMEWASHASGDAAFAENLETTTYKYFNVSGLQKATLNAHAAKVERAKQELERNEITEEEFADRYAAEIEELLLKRFRSRFVPIHRKLARSIGFIAPYQGPSQRFILGDNLLKALVLSNVAPGKRLPYDEFLDRLYYRYGIVVGQQEARDSGLYDRRPINAEYYDDNRAALQLKLRSAALLEEYSDATALVVNEWRERAVHG